MKKIIIITISIFLLFGIWHNIYAGELLLKYPEIQGVELGKGEAATLPGIIKYIYLFALGTVGVIALLAILIGAIMYVTSAGNPGKAKDAKDRIMSALLGVIILLASVLILRTINPSLVNFEFKLPEVEIPQTPGEPGECSILSAAWDKDKINAGESANIILDWNKEDCKNEVLKEFELFIKQEYPGDKDEKCEEIKTISFPNNPPFKYKYTFNKECTTKILGLDTDTNCMDVPLICNYRENSYEVFYLEGKIQLQGKYEQSISRDTIGVEDNK